MTILDILKAMGPLQIGFGMWALCYGAHYEISHLLQKS